MKFSWMMDEERMIPCRIAHKGVLRELELHYLSAADIDAADREHPVRVIPEDSQPTATDEAAAMARMVCIAVMAMGKDRFVNNSPDGMAQELLSAFSKVAIIEIATTVYTASQMTPQMLEEAKAAINPTGSES